MAEQYNLFEQQPPVADKIGLTDALPYAESAEAEWFEIGPLSVCAMGDRVIIQEDEFKSGYECTTCGGVGTTACDACGGSGKSGVVEGARCSACASKGTQTCSACLGKGGLLVVAEVSQRRPTTGVVMSAGPKCKELKVGDSVLYSNFAGYVIDLASSGRPVVLRILHETEILAGMKGKLEMRTLRGKSEIAIFNG